MRDSSGLISLCIIVEKCMQPLPPPPPPQHSRVWEIAMLVESIEVWWWYLHYPIDCHWERNLHFLNFFCLCCIRMIKLLESFSREEEWIPGVVSQKDLRFRSYLFFEQPLLKSFASSLHCSASEWQKVWHVSKAPSNKIKSIFPQCMQALFPCVSVSPEKKQQPKKGISEVEGGRKSNPNLC